MLSAPVVPDMDDIKNWGELFIYFSASVYLMRHYILKLTRRQAWKSAWLMRAGSSAGSTPAMTDIFQRCKTMGTEATEQRPGGAPTVPMFGSVT